MRRRRTRRNVVRKTRGINARKNRRQKGGAFGAALALGMFLPQVLGTLGKVLKINA